MNKQKKVKAAAASKFIGSLYEGPIKLSDLQDALLTASFQGEVGKPTPPKDQKIQSMIYQYLQAKKSHLTDDQLGSFSPLVKWICVGSELGKLLALLPNTSLEDVIKTAKEHGFDVEVSA